MISSNMLYNLMRSDMFTQSVASSPTNLIWPLIFFLLDLRIEFGGPRLGVRTKIRTKIKFFFTWSLLCNTNIEYMHIQYKQYKYSTSMEILVRPVSWFIDHEVWIQVVQVYSLWIYLNWKLIELWCDDRSHCLFIPCKWSKTMISNKSTWMQKKVSFVFNDDDNNKTSK